MLMLKDAVCKYTGELLLESSFDYAIDKWIRDNKLQGKVEISYSPERNIRLKRNVYDDIRLNYELSQLMVWTI